VVAVLIGLAGCGSQASKTSSEPLAVSATCTANSAGQHRCVATFDNGERISCDTFVTGLPSVRGLLATRGCRSIAALRLTTVTRAVIVRLDHVKLCIEQKGQRTFAGPVLGQPTHGGPGGEVGVYREGSGGALIAFYTDDGLARGAERTVARNVATVGGTLERRGIESVLWFRSVRPAVRAAVNACVV
jgi:hypothetical protein